MQGRIAGGDKKMASIDVAKYSSSGQAKAMLRHDDSKMREQANFHTNDQIDKSKSHLNVNLTGRSYEEAKRYYDDMVFIARSKAKRKARADQVTLVSYETPCPEWMTSREDKIAFQQRVLDIQCEMFGRENLVSSHIHFDEVHDYYDPKEGRMRTSLVHAHTTFVPVDKDGCLRAKNITSRVNIVRMNNAVNEMCVKEFGKPFNNGKGKRGKSVEALKSDTRLAEMKAEEERLKIEREKNEATKRALNDREARLIARERALDDREDDLRRQAKDLSSKEQNVRESAHMTSETLSEARKNLETIQTMLTDAKAVKTESEAFWEKKYKRAANFMAKKKLSESTTMLTSFETLEKFQHHKSEPTSANDIQMRTNRLAQDTEEIERKFNRRLPRGFDGLDF
jgi:hypothetical protein